MTTTEEFDAFERRLAATLTAEAATVVEPEDGLEVVRGRVAHRRRTRRAAWLAAAAALVIVAGTAGVLLRSTSTDSAPYVDSTTAGGRLPLLAFADQDVGIGGPMLLGEFQPGYSYTVTDNKSGGLMRLSVVAGSDPAPARLPGEEAVRVDGREAPLRRDTVPPDGHAIYTVSWNPEPGVRATLQLDRAPELTGSEAILRTSAQRVVRLTTAEFGAAIDDPDVVGPGLRPLVPRDVSGASVEWISPASGLLIDLGPVLAPEGGDLTIVGASTGDIDRYIEGAEEVQVRGARGYVSAGTGDDGVPARRLAWEEAGAVHILRLTSTAANEPLLLVADGLRPPTSDEWDRLLFPELRPVGGSTAAGSGP